MKLNKVLCQLLPLLIPSAPLLAQSFAGQFTARVAAGDAILDLRPAGAGAVKGSLNLPNGTSLQLTGTYQGAVLSGIAREGSESEKFSARLNGQQLVLYVGNIELPFNRQVVVPVASAPQVASSEVNDASLGFRFRTPAGFTAKPDGVWYLLTSPETATRILVMRHTAASFAEIRKLASEQFSYGKAFSLSPASAVQVVNASTLAVDLSGTIESRPGNARMVAMQSPYGGGGAVVLAGGANGNAGEYAALTDAVAKTIQFQKVDASPAMQFWSTRLRGKKLHYFNTYSSGYGSGSGYADHKQVSLCSDGSFYFNGQFSGGINVPGATASMGRNNGDAGRWKLVPNQDHAVLALTFSDGSQATYTLADQAGKTLLNGKRWLMEDSKECR